MRYKVITSLLFALGSCGFGLRAEAQTANWKTTYEKSGGVATERYDETVAYCRRLATASKGRARVVVWGTSPQGRSLVALVLSSEGAFTPAAAVKSSRPLVVINNGIHSGEIEGKDADLILARDILITGSKADLLAHLNLLIIPIFSVDAHERFSPYNRINQNGPTEMGWRATAVNLNLNRDFMKADGEEMQAMLRLLHGWKPDFFFDNHTTDGADWQYTIQLDTPVAPTLGAGAVAWSKQMLAAALPRVENDGFLTSPYFDGVDYNRLDRGLTISDFGPRYSTGYLAAMNRPSMLVETHMLKPYRNRVEATYSINRRVIEYIAASGKELREINRNADAAESHTKPGDRFVLEATTSRESRPFTFRGLEYRPFRSEVSGSMIPAWTRNPQDTLTTIRDQYLPGLTLEAPAAYAIPPQWKEVLQRLNLHGFEFKRLTHAYKSQFESYRFASVAFPPSPFESRFQPNYKTTKITEERTLPPGTVVISTACTGAKLLMQLLEPEAPDSLMHWGLFNNVFEQKEYFENYAMEPIAATMLADDPKLKAEFEEKLKDLVFAGNPRARLQFLYERSRYADAFLNRYPVVRLTAAQLVECTGPSH